MEKEVLITKDMTIGEVVTKYPQTTPVFLAMVFHVWDAMLLNGKV